VRTTLLQRAHTAYRPIRHPLQQDASPHAKRPAYHVCCSVHAALITYKLILLAIMHAQRDPPQNHHKPQQTVLGIILGGGAGSRLYPLTKSRAKPAVPLGANYRLIDIPVSNCVNSNVTKIYTLTQFNSASLNRHLSQAYVRSFCCCMFWGWAGWSGGWSGGLVRYARAAEAAQADQQK